MLTTLTCKKLPTLLSTRKPNVNGYVPFTHLRKNNQNPRSPQPLTKTTQEMLTPSPIWKNLSITKPTLYAFLPFTHLKMNKQNPRSAGPHAQRSLEMFTSIWKTSLLSIAKATINAPLSAHGNKKCFCTHANLFSQEEIHLDQTIRKIKSGVLLLESYYVRNGVLITQSSGTAFLVQKNIASTNAHNCCKQFGILSRGMSRRNRWIKAAVYGRFSDQKTLFRLTILALNTLTDTCLLGLPIGMADPELHFCAELCFEIPLLGQSLFFIGNPGLPFCIKRGMFSCVRTPLELFNAGLYFSAMKVDALEFEAVAPPGTSGSSVFDRLGRVFAMVFGGNSLVEVDSGALSMYAVPASHIKQLLDWHWLKERHDSVFVHNDSFDEEYEDSYLDDFIVGNTDYGILGIESSIRKIAGIAAPYKGKGALKVSRRKLGKRTKKLMV